VYIDFDLEKYPLEIKTDGALGSNEHMDVDFYDSSGNMVGSVWIIFYSTPTYCIYGCTPSSPYTAFPFSLPSATNKVWKITLTRISGIRLKIHCNGVEMVNILMSDSTCSYSGWRTYWSRIVTKMQFHSDNYAADYYRAGLVYNCD
jgi:hypothetical protein